MNELHSAAYDGHPGWVQTCLLRGDPVDARDSRGYTALLWSCFRGLVCDQVAVASLLIDAGADLNANVQPAGESCLQLACQSSNFLLVELLLDHGANPNLIADELSPLMFAVRCREENIARLLVARGADVAYQLHGRNAADYAEYEGFEELGAFLRSVTPNNPVQRTGPDGPSTDLAR